MFLKIKGMELPDFAAAHTVSEGVDEWKGLKASWVCPLGETFWPDDIKQKVSDIYKKVGIADPLKQKLVEPFAGCFGGKNQEGVPVFSKVNWNALLDYFEWEAAEISENKVKAQKLQDKAEKKYGGIFFHYNVYVNYSNLQ